MESLVTARMSSPANTIMTATTDLAVEPASHVDANSLSLPTLTTTTLTPIFLVANVSIVSCWLDLPYDMSAAYMPTCLRHVMRHVGKMSNAVTCPRWYQKASVPMR